MLDIQPIVDYFNQGHTVYYSKKAARSKNNRVAIYIRVSTKLQEHKFSLRAQIQELTRYAEQMGWDIIAIYRDVDSGGKLDKKGLSTMLDDVDEDKIDVVLCIEQDRLSRLDTVAWEYLKSQLRENDVKIAEPGNITDLANEDDEFISDIKNLIAKREKRSIVKKMMRGKRQRTREGKGWGKPPWEFNYDKNTGSYTINEKWAWVIQYIDDKYLNEGLSDANIALALTAVTKTPSGKAWDSQHIRQRLNSKAYHGVMEKSFGNGETIVVDNVFPLLRSEETWHKIQAKRKQKYQRRAPVHPHLLRNVHTTCGYCGHKLAVKQSGSAAYAFHYYLQHSTEYKHNYSPNCGMSINTIRIEFNLVKAVKEILASEETAKRYIQFEFSQADIDKLTADIAAANRLLNDVQAKYDNLLDLVLDGGGGFSKAALETKQASLEAERDAHTARKRQLEDRKEALAANMFNYEVVYQYLAVAERFEVELNEHEKMEMVGRLFSSGVLYEDRYVLQGNIAGITFEVEVPVAPDPFAHLNNVWTKQKEEKRKGQLD
ncbi:recombinase family protein [Paenibacillus sp. BK720]|uniref:recombinase family protein n=1 Tax=Paenibacillus sp. BK720 TaxID=2587092 RepID=UPI00141D7DA2|nr:recombinase family protein [Paenibacillus sp. BK720]NIK67893.1 DNA invertase Pin-like site-specific DNA recombinase [Paenibacillus sp. BK720]